jgi:hypothetical protein
MRERKAGAKKGAVDLFSSDLAKGFPQMGDLYLS